MRTIAVLNQKGGVGKTTTVVNTAAALAALGAKVIAIDLDPQAHLTIHLGLEPASIDSGSYKVLTQSARLESEIMMVRPNLWLLPANIDLVGAESELVSVVGREIILREALQECRQNFDYCIIDCAPSLGLLTLNALAAAEEVLIPLQPHFLALQGFGKLLQTVEIVNRRINPSLKVNGILLCMFDSRASLPNEVKADIERFLNDARGTNSAWAEAHVLPVLVRRNIKLAEAPSYGQTIFEYEKACHGAEDYQKVAEFIHAQTHRPEESVEAVDIQEEYAQNEDTNEFQELSAESDDIQENHGQPEPEISIDYHAGEQSEYSADDETTQQDSLQNQQQISEESQSIKPEYSNDIQENPNQPEQLNAQPDYTNEIPQKPPIEIKEFQSHSSHEPDQHKQISENSNQPEQTNDNPEHEHQGF